MNRPFHDQQDIEILQSLIQKAVRRGDAEIVRRVIQCLVQRNNQEWLRRRAPILVFEECWTYGQHFEHPKDEQQLTEQLVRLAGTIKNKNACGLGSLAYQLYRGDETVIHNDAMEKDLLFVAVAMSKP